MKPDEIRNLAIGCGADVRHYPLSDDEIKYVYVLDSEELAAYTAAVEARERERCALIADRQPHGNSIASRIRELK